MSEISALVSRLQQGTGHLNPEEFPSSRPIDIFHEIKISLELSSKATKQFVTLHVDWFHRRPFESLPNPRYLARDMNRSQRIILA